MLESPKCSCGSHTVSQRPLNSTAGNVHIWQEVVSPSVSSPAPSLLSLKARTFSDACHEGTRPEGVCAKVRGINDMSLKRQEQNSSQLTFFPIDISVIVRDARCWSRNESDSNETGPSENTANPPFKNDSTRMTSSSLLTLHEGSISASTYTGMLSPSSISILYLLLIAEQVALSKSQLGCVSTGVAQTSIRGYRCPAGLLFTHFHKDPVGFPRFHCLSLPVSVPWPQTFAGRYAYSWLFARW